MFNGWQLRRWSDDPKKSAHSGQGWQVTGRIGKSWMPCVKDTRQGTMVQVLGNIEIEMFKYWPRDYHNPPILGSQFQFSYAIAVQINDLMQYYQEKQDIKTNKLVLFAYIIAPYIIV